MSNSATVVVFACNWDGLSCVEAAAQKRLSIPSSVRIIRVSCLSRVHTGLMLKALEFGADGVMLLGCDSHNCHFGIEEKLIDQNYDKALSVMRLLGLKQDRLALVRLPHGDGIGFTKRVKDFANQFDKLSIVSS